MMILFTKSVSNRPVMVNTDHIVKISPIQGKDDTKCAVLLSDNSVITVKDSFEDICKVFSLRLKNIPLYEEMALRKELF